jgi:hypothetical protein
MMNWVYPDPRYFISSTNQVLLNYSHQNLYPDGDDPLSFADRMACGWLFGHYCRQSKSFTRLPSVVNFTVKFSSQDLSFYRALPVSRTSDTTGYVASPGFDEGFQYTSPFDGWANLTVPVNHTVMVSFPVFNIYSTRAFSYDILEFTVYGSNHSLRYQSESYRHRFQNQSEHTSVIDVPYQQADREVIVQWNETGSKSVPAQVFHNAMLITLHLFSLIHLDPMPDDQRPIELGAFKMLYSFHSSSDSPTQVVNTLFNCSGDLYTSFRQHLHCNMEVECFNREDETG